MKKQYSLFVEVVFALIVLAVIFIVASHALNGQRPTEKEIQVVENNEEFKITLLSPANEPVRIIYAENKNILRHTANYLGVEIKINETDWIIWDGSYEIIKENKKHE
jgi:hypothetical protein